MKQQIFIVGTACTHLQQLYKEAISLIEGATPLAERNMKIVADCVVRGSVPPEKVIKLYRDLAASRTFVDKSHPVLWLTEKLIAALPNAIFIAMRPADKDLNHVVHLMTRNVGCKQWCRSFDSVKFPSKFLGAESSSSYRSLDIRKKCRARLLSHTAEIDRLSAKYPKRFHTLKPFGGGEGWKEKLKSILVPKRTNHPVKPQPTRGRRLPPKRAVKPQPKPTRQRLKPQPKQTRGRRLPPVNVKTQRPKPPVVKTVKTPVNVKNVKTQHPKPPVVKTVKTPVNANNVKPPVNAKSVKTPVNAKNVKTVKPPAPVKPPVVKNVKTVKPKAAPTKKRAQSAPPVDPNAEMKLPNMPPTPKTTKLSPKIAFYWVNLDRAKARRKQLETQLESRGIRNYRIEAVDGRKKDALEPFIPKSWHGRYRYELATTLSHLKAVHRFLRTGDDIGIICEDDTIFEFERKWPTSLQCFIDGAPDDWRILQLSMTNANAREWNKIRAANKRYVVRREQYFSALTYAIKRSHALSLAKKYNINVNSNTFTAHLKGSVSRMQSERVVLGTGRTKYTVYPSLFTYPTGNTSFVHPNHLRGHEMSKKLSAEQYKYDLPTK